jgi:uncharacterized protein (TIGR00251 family)
LEGPETIALRADGDGTVIAVRAVPRARRDTLAGVRAGSLRVTVTAPPEGGRANRAIVETIARALGIPRSRVRLVRGERSRAKSVRVEGETVDSVRERIARALREGR